mgnify:CR=1 FL=1
MNSIHEIWGIRHFHLMLDAFFRWLFTSYVACKNCGTVYEDSSCYCPNCGRVDR